MGSPAIVSVCVQRPAGCAVLPSAWWWGCHSAMLQTASAANLSPCSSTCLSPLLPVLLPTRSTPLPAPQDYYHPDNSCINTVLERRTGIPISLSLVYMEVGGLIGGWAGGLRRHTLAHVHGGGWLDRSVGGWVGRWWVTWDFGRAGAVHGCSRIVRSRTWRWAGGCSGRVLCCRSLDPHQGACILIRHQWGW